MTQKGSGDGETGLGDTIQNLIVSSVRLSTGLTLYGIGELQKIFEAGVGGKGLPGAAEKLGSSLNEFSSSLERNLDETKKEALRSVSRVSVKAVEKAFQTFSPAAILEAGNQLLGRSNETRAYDTTGNETPGGARPANAPLAVDVLSGPPAD